MNTSIQYKALVARKNSSGEMNLNVEDCSTENLPDHNVLVRVHYSSLNYKDALSATGNPGVTKQYPHTPGIDAAGVVEESDSPRFKKGDRVIVTSYDLGQNTSGGFGQYIRVPDKWIVHLPNNLSLKESMILGTAGFTAAYGVKKIVDYGITPEDGNVLISGATGGVGSLAVAILSKLSYKVMAATGKDSQHDFLKQLGASEVIHRDSIYVESKSPLLSSRWIAGIDTVGGEMLDNILRQTAHNGYIACCGNILGGSLNTSIYPFILRGIGLMGIDSGICLMKDRLDIWGKLSGEWKPDMPENLYRECRLENIEDEIRAILNGEQTGRVLLNLGE